MVLETVILVALCAVLSSGCGTDGSETRPRIDTNTVVIIDVRSPAEWEEGHIPGAILIPYKDVGRKIDAHVPDKGTPIVLYCRSGRRAGIALDHLRSLGYTNVVNYGGISEARRKLER